MGCPVFVTRFPTCVHPLNVAEGTNPLQRRGAELCGVRMQSADPYRSVDLTAGSAHSALDDPDPSRAIFGAGREREAALEPGPHGGMDASSPHSPGGETG